MRSFIIAKFNSSQVHAVVTISDGLFNSEINIVTVKQRVLFAGFNKSAMSNNSKIIETTKQCRAYY